MVNKYRATEVEGEQYMDEEIYRKRNMFIIIWRVQSQDVFFALIL